MSNVKLAGQFGPTVLVLFHYLFHFFSLNLLFFLFCLPKNTDGTGLQGLYGLASWHRTVLCYLKVSLPFYFQSCVDKTPTPFLQFLPGTIPLYTLSQAALAMSLAIFFFFFFFRWEKVSLHNPGCPGTDYIDQAAFNCLCLWSSGLKMCATTPRFSSFLFHSYMCDNKYISIHTRKECLFTP